MPLYSRNTWGYMHLEVFDHKGRRLEHVQWVDTDRGIARVGNKGITLEVVSFETIRGKFEVRDKRTGKTNPSFNDLDILEAEDRLRGTTRECKEAG